jgi:hypothetical protein
MQAMLHYFQICRQSDPVLHHGHNTSSLEQAGTRVRRRTASCPAQKILRRRRRPFGERRRQISTGVASMRQIRPRKSRPRAVIGWGGATVAPGPHRYPQPVALLRCINTARAGGELTHPPTHQQSTVHSQQYRLELAELLQCELASYSPNIIHGSPAPPFHALRPQEGNYYSTPRWSTRYPNSKEAMQSLVAGCEFTVVVF